MAYQPQRTIALLKVEYIDNSIKLIKIQVIILYYESFAIVAIVKSISFNFSTTQVQNKSIRKQVQFVFICVTVAMVKLVF